MQNSEVLLESVWQGFFLILVYDLVSYNPLIPPDIPKSALNFSCVFEQPDMASLTLWYSPQEEQGRYLTSISMFLQI